MIDTNTYEGHSPKPWRRKVNQTTYSIINSNSQKIASVPCYDRCDIDSLLMRDAPLLLEEVKELREKYERLHDATAELLNKHFGSSFVKAFWEAIE